MRRGIPTLSLFSGAGGLDIGFHEAGFDIAACVEIEPSYSNSLQANIGSDKFFGARTKVFCQDIREFDPTPFKRAGIECVIGGPPCQTFSAAGRRSGGVIGINDERGQLFRAYCDILKVVQPKVFLFENVYGITGANDGKPWRAISEAFSNLGYTLATEVLDAADYGVPQHRERLFIVGALNGEFAFPLPTHGPDSASRRPLVSVLEAIGDLQKESEPAHEGLGGLYGHLLPLVPEGLNYAFFTAEMGHPEPLFAWRSKFHDLLYKVNRNEPCRTIKAQPGKFTGPFHWKNRHFTLPEFKRLQTFPDRYDLVGTFNKVVEQIGNSVPPRLANVLATSVREQLLTRVRRLTYQKRPDAFQSTFRQRQRERTHKFKVVAQQEIERRYKKQLVKPKARRDESYSIGASGFFDQAKLAPKAVREDQRHIFDVKVEDLGSRVELRFKSARARNGSAWQMRICIAGLSKYLGRIDEMAVAAKLGHTDDVFYLWGAIEQALRTRSKFFSLIDIYGHYANRGDTIRVVTSIPEAPSRVHKAIEFFGDSWNCGEFQSRPALASALQIRESELDSLIQQLRELRYDVRTHHTHPILGSSRVICTYPFPLLSPRALVESRAKFVTVAEPAAHYQLAPT